MSVESSPIGCRGRVTSSGGIRPGRTGEVMVAIRGGVEAFLAHDGDRDEIPPYRQIQEIIDPTGYIRALGEPSEIIAQVIGQAGPALEMAREALARSKNGSTPPPEG